MITQPFPNSPNKAQQSIDALNRSIEQMKANGRWLQAYRQAAVINPLVDDWVLLNPR